MKLIKFVVVDGIDLSNLLPLQGIEPQFRRHPAHSLVTVLNMLFVYCQKWCAQHQWKIVFKIEYMGSQPNNSILGHFQYTPEEKWMIWGGGSQIKWHCCTIKTHPWNKYFTYHMRFIKWLFKLLFMCPLQNFMWQSLWYFEITQRLHH
jgi:hypothetical protein